MEGWNKTWILVIVATCAMILSPSPTNAVNVFGIQSSSNQNNFSVSNPYVANSGTAIPLSGSPTYVALDIAAYNDARRLVYTVEQQGFGFTSGNPYVLVTRNIDTQQVISQVSIDNYKSIISLQYDNDQQLLFGVVNNSGQYLMVQINASTGAFTQLLILSSAISSMAIGISTYDITRHYYYTIGTEISGTSYLYTINMNGGQAKLLYRSPLSTSDITNIAYDSSTNNLFLISKQAPTASLSTPPFQFGSIAPATGVITKINDFSPFNNPVLYSERYDYLSGRFVLQTTPGGDANSVPASTAQPYHILALNSQTGLPVTDITQSTYSIPDFLESPLLSITAPIQQTDEDIAFNLAPWTLVSPSTLSAYGRSYQYTLTLSVLHGYLSEGINKSQDPSRSMTLVLTDTIANLNSRLQRIWYIGVLHYFGNDTLSSVLADPAFTGSTSMGVIRPSPLKLLINVISVNDPPVIVGLSSTYSVSTICAPQPFSTLTVTDVDGQLTPNSIREIWMRVYVRGTTTTGDGSITLNMAAVKGPLTFLAGPTTGIGATLQFYGYPDYANQAITGSVFSFNSQTFAGSTLDVWIKACDRGFSGKGGELCVNTTTTISVINANVLPVTSLVMDNSLNSLITTFCFATNLAGMQLLQQSSCTSLYSASAITTFGTGPTCVWTSATVLVVNLGDNPTILPGQSVVSTMNGLVFGTGARSTWTVMTSDNTQTLQSPVAPVTPVAVITAPNSVDRCSDVILSGTSSTGNGRRVMTYAWSLLSASPNITTAQFSAISTTLNTSGSVVTVQNAILPFGTTYVFGLQVTNFLSTKSPRSSSVVLKTSLFTPNIQSATSVAAGTPGALMIPTTATINGPTSCSTINKEASFTYQWMVIGSPSFAIDATTSTTPTLYIAPYTLSPGLAYKLRLTVNVLFGANPVSQDITVNVGYSPIQAVIAGGSRSVIASKALVLDGSGSNDPDYTTQSNPSQFTWTWTCYDTTAKGSCSAAITTAIAAAANQQSVTIPASAMTVASVYSYSLQIAKAGGTTMRTSQTTVLVSALADPPLNIAIVNPPSKVGFGSYLSLKTQSTDSAAASFKYLWTMAENSAAGTVIDLTQSLSGATNNYLSLAPNFILAGRTYNVKVTVSNASGNSGYSQISIISVPVPACRQVTTPATNQAPCSVFAPSTGGSALSTSYSFTASDWVAGDATSPSLSYTWTYSTTLNGVATTNVLGTSSTGILSNVLLPSPSTGTTLVVTLFVTDTYTSYVSSTMNVQVSLPVGDLNNAATAAVAAILANINQQQSSQALASIGSVFSTFSNQQQKVNSTVYDSLVASVKALTSNINTNTMNSASFTQQTSVLNQLVTGGSISSTNVGSVGESINSVLTAAKQSNQSPSTATTTNIISTLGSYISNVNSAGSNTDKSLAATTTFSALGTLTNILISTMVPGDKPLTFQTPQINYAAFITTGASSSSSTTTLKVTGNSRRRMLAAGAGSLTLPVNYPALATPVCTTTNTQSVFIEQVVNPFSFSPSSSDIRSSVWTAAIQDSKGNNLNYINLSSQNAISVSIPYSNGACPTSNPSCNMVVMGWDKSLQMWSTNGVTTTSSSAVVAGGIATATSTFLAPAYAVFPSTTTTPVALTSTLSTGQTIAIICVAVAVGAVIVVTMFVYVRSRREQQEKTTYEAERAAVEAMEQASRELQQQQQPHGLMIDRALVAAGGENALASQSRDAEQGRHVDAVEDVNDSSNVQTVKIVEESNVSRAAATAGAHGIRSASQEPRDEESGETPGGVTRGENDEQSQASGDLEADEANLEARIRELDNKLQIYREKSNLRASSVEAEFEGDGGEAWTKPVEVEREISAAYDEEKANVGQAEDRGFERYMSTSKLGTLRNLYARRKGSNTAGSPEGSSSNLHPTSSGVSDGSGGAVILPHRMSQTGVGNTARNVDDDYDSEE